MEPMAPVLPPYLPEICIWKEKHCKQGSAFVAPSSLSVKAGVAVALLSS